MCCVPLFRPLFPWVCLAALMIPRAWAQTNLVANADFSAKEPLEGWRTAFPHEGWYTNNVSYVKVVPDPVQGTRPCVEISLPPGIAGNQGGKIESAFIRAEPGATYQVEVDCLTWDFSAKLHVEVYTADPSPKPQPSKFRVPAGNGLPALVMCHRAQLPDPPARSKQWSTVSREFKLPEKVQVRGEEKAPEYLVLKAVVYEGTMGAGKSYFTNFRLRRAQ